MSIFKTSPQTGEAQRISAVIMQAPLTVIHLVPYDGLGGVEVAARSMLFAPRRDIDFSVAYIDCHRRKTRFARLGNNPLAYLRVMRRLWSDRPDVLICSLWRSALVGLVMKLAY